MLVKLASESKAPRFLIKDFELTGVESCIGYSRVHH